MDAYEQADQMIADLQRALAEKDFSGIGETIATGLGLVLDAFNAISAERDALLAALHPEPLQGRCECGQCVRVMACDDASPYWGYEDDGTRLPDDSFCDQCGCLLDSGGVARPRPKAPEEGK